MKPTSLFTILVALVLCQIGLAQAHEVRPAYLQLKQVDKLTYDMLWKVPAKGDRRLGLYVRLPDHCHSSGATSRFVNGAYVERLQVTCESGLSDGKVAIDGLEATRTDVLARVEHKSGHTQTVRLTPSEPEFIVSGATSHAAVVRTYFNLGVEHILLGFDHLLFVLALLFLVEGWRRLLGTITAFTVAHSLTLMAATFGWVRVPQAPVEAVIALSIMFVAVEILHQQRGLTGIATRKPWVVAFVFGLLHGLGFAGALREIGLPEHAIPLSLAFFNVGVEAGQLLFIGTMFLLFRFFNQLMNRRDIAAEPSSLPGAVVIRPASYVIGTLAAFWLAERTYGFFV
ncbi:MAG: HupE/UreJ family protein [Candidatus Promineifilaceae bacterium]|jgi:hydrogenase/urease accessory protein HupE